MGPGGDEIRAVAKRPPNRAKRLECVELAPAIEGPATSESGSKLHALQTLRELERLSSLPKAWVKWGKKLVRSL
jgi:hypothetical protein